MRATRSTWAAVGAATVLAWYALPDFVRSRTWRGVIKTGLLAVTAAGVAVIPQVWEGAGEVPDRVEAALADLPKPAVAGLFGAAMVAGTALTVWFEKVVFVRGERRRAQGVRLAHTRPAVALAAATAAAALVDWPCKPATS